MKIIGAEWHSAGATYNGCVGVVLTKDDYDGYIAYMGVTAPSSMDEEYDKKNIAAWGSKVPLEFAYAWNPHWKTIVEGDKS